MIINVVPKQQLLIMKLEDGWEPLCKFLGKPIPDIPFPQVNDREAADRVGHGIFAKLMLTWLGLFFVMGTSIYFGMQAWNSGALYPAE